MSEQLHITVMEGGPSAEREVSLRTGVAVRRALRANGHKVSVLDPIGDKWQLPVGTDGVFLALHGTYGEDGQVQGRLDALGVPYTGSSAESSAVAFDKAETKHRLERAGVTTPAWIEVKSNNVTRPDWLQMPLVLKPVCQGSSVGLEFVESSDQWLESLIEVLKHEHRAIAEEKIIGREVTVSIIDGCSLPIVEMRPKRGPYDYHNKYTQGATEYFCPAEFDAVMTDRLRSVGLAAFNAVGANDYGRVDIIVDEVNQPHVLEVNTLPGLTETSLLPKAAAAAGLEFTELCETILAMALKRELSLVR